jgi:hypothetical protein
MSHLANNATEPDFPMSKAALFSPCPVDWLPRRRRNKICVWIIAIGTLNFLIYTVIYAALGGDAHNGEVKLLETGDGKEEPAYFVRGHFIRSLDGKEARVSRGVWIYSYVHSMSVFVTSAAMIVSMLVLARPHILATMRDGWVGGQTFVTALTTVVILITSAALFVFVWDFARELRVE